MKLEQSPTKKEQVPRLMEQISSRGDVDGVFICFASPEARCLGVASRMRDYQAKRICILKIEDEPNKQRAQNIKKLRNLFKPVGEIKEIGTRHADPLCGLDKLARSVRDAIEPSGQITVDISTFPKNSLLLTLRALEMIPAVKSIRALYTEPEGYDLGTRDGQSFGLKRTRVVPTFAAPLRPREELVLIILLGYEGDRAVGLWQRMQPHRTIAAIGRPPYRPEWEGDCERINAPLLATLEQRDIFNLNPRNPWSVYSFLVEILVKPSGRLGNFFIAPLGTKPETVGVYLFARQFPEVATVVYAPPVNPKHQYIARGLGPTWELASWENSNDSAQN